MSRIANAVMFLFPFVILPIYAGIAGWHIQTPFICSAAAAFYGRSWGDIHGHSRMKSFFMGFMFGSMVTVPMYLFTRYVLA